ncbi:ATP-binding cassette domain-containing protein [Verrucomicrobiales bacterium]|nr:ATP-binding cassette domain-containing protein [Verrucomicrobiales bacterium]
MSFTVDDVHVTFGETGALRGVSLTVGEGEQLALTGPSGAGKTTLLRLLNATVLPTSGSVSAFGETLSSLSPRDLRAVRSKIALVPQDLALVPGLRVIQNVALGRLGSRGTFGGLRDFLLPARETVAQIHDILERVGIPEKLYERTASLSGGQQQRVAIARALFQKPRALLADEPVSSVDPARAHDMVQLITKLAKEDGISIIMSLHHQNLAEEFFPKIIHLEDGKIPSPKPK